MKKSELKQIIKECLQELIEQGSFDNHINFIIEQKISSKSFLNENMQSKDANKSKLKEMVKNAVGYNTKYADAFMDTAINTLPQQLAKETDSSMFGGNHTIKKIMTEGSGYDDDVKLEDEKQLNMLSNGNIDRWKKLAFSTISNKGKI